MALKGTLRDFGIADILQLIGQQQKSGLLRLKSKEHEVSISFKDGAIVDTERVTRRKKNLIGEMLVRAELITEAQLAHALDEQKRMLKRLGDVLVQGNAITRKRFQEMMQLQATETLYQLFMWKSGTYAFEAKDVEADPDGIAPLRAESVLMEGFRMVDEWPVVRKKISSYELTFTRLKEPPPPPKEEEEDDLAGFDDAFSEEKPEERKGDFASLGKTERKVMEVAKPGRTVGRIIDVSTLGEFETCKGLLNLVNLGYLQIVDNKRGGAAPLDAGNTLGRKLGAAGARVLAAAVVVAVLAFAATRVRWETIRLSGTRAGALVDSASDKLLSRSQQARIEAALAVYQVEKGELPAALEMLVTSGLLRGDDLQYPWQEKYYYRRLNAREFILLPPLR
jgi:hypothetical protein